MLPHKQGEVSKQQKRGLKEYNKHTAMEQIGTLLQRRQYTRKDLNIDQDSTDDPNMSYDFLKGRAPSRSLGNALEALSSSGSSQSSSTVVRNTESPSKTTNEQLKNISLSTLEMDANFREKLHVALTSARENRTVSGNNTSVEKARSPVPSSLITGNFSTDKDAGTHSNVHKGTIYQDEEVVMDDPPTEREDKHVRMVESRTKENARMDNSQNVSGNTGMRQCEEHEEEIVDDYDDDDDDDDFGNQLLTDYTEGLLPSPPASPPRELDPNKLYALYDFSGPDSSQVELSKDDAVQLLNDSDSFWWLVRRTGDGTVGFAPAEILETYEERLARLNCWKNEVLERGTENTHLSTEDLKLLDYNPVDRKAASNSDGTNGTGKNMSSSLDSIPSSLTSYNSSSMQSLRSMKDHLTSAGAASLGRKSSLKRGKSTHKKNVTFAGSLPQLTEETSEVYLHNASGDDDEKDVVAKHVEASIPLIVPKRACRTNFLINDLDEYDRTQKDSNPPSAPFVNGYGSIGSYSPSTNSDYSDGWGNDEVKVKEAKVIKEHRCLSNSNNAIVKENSEVNESRFNTLRKLSGKDEKCNKGDNKKKHSIPLSQSIQMLDDLIQNSPEFSSQRLRDKGNKFVDAEFVPPDFNDQDSSTGPSTISTLRKRYKSEDLSYNNVRKVKDTRKPPRAVSDSGSFTKLHPVTSEIFNPLMNHMEELEKMMKDIYIENPSTHK